MVTSMCTSDPRLFLSTSLTPSFSDSALLNSAQSYPVLVPVHQAPSGCIKDAGSGGWVALIRRGNRCASFRCYCNGCNHCPASSAWLVNRPHYEGSLTIISSMLKHKLSKQNYASKSKCVGENGYKSICARATVEVGQPSRQLLRRIARCYSVVFW